MEQLPDIDIRSARQALDMTQTEFAEALGVVLSTVWRWEKNKITPPRWAIKAASRLVDDARPS